jgi:hypothetical protein
MPKGREKLWRGVLLEETEEATSSLLKLMAGGNDELLCKMRRQATKETPLKRPEQMRVWIKIRHLPLY